GGSLGHRRGRRAVLRGIQGAAMTVGFIGLGNMGGRIARRIVDHGHAVIGYDVAEGAAERVGATPAATIADATTGGDAVFMSLPDSKVVEKVVLGEGGVRDHARKGQVVVDLSTAA